MLYREPKLLKFQQKVAVLTAFEVSVLYREPKLLKFIAVGGAESEQQVSVLYREPKLLKSRCVRNHQHCEWLRFSALP